jgi:hypothetical protein
MTLVVLGDLLSWHSTMGALEHCFATLRLISGHQNWAASVCQCILQTPVRPANGVVWHAAGMVALNKKGTIFL